MYFMRTRPAYKIILPKICELPTGVQIHNFLTRVNDKYEYRPKLQNSLWTYIQRKLLAPRTGGLYQTRNTDKQILS
jgi:hypothetical protein